METTEIPLSKKKLLLLLTGSVLFVGLGVWFILSPDKFTNSFTRNANFVLIIGVAAIIFFGFCALVAIKKLFDARPGMVINAEGITDNSSGISNGVIRWSEITGISTAQVQSQRFILIKVTDPEKRLADEPGSFKKRMMKINHRMYGTPVCISPNSLQCSFDELYSTITGAFERYKK